MVANHTLTAGAGRTMTAAEAITMAPARAWHRMRTGQGTKGTRHYDWAMVEVTSNDTPQEHADGHSILLARRHRYTGKLSFYRCWTPQPVALARLIAIAVARWRIEEDHQIAKQATGLDAGQVIRWKPWHRWTAICLLAYTYLAVAAAIQRQHDATTGLDTGLIPITVPELLGSCATPSSRHPGATRPTGGTGPPGDGATSTAPAKPINTGTITPGQPMITTNYSCRN